MCGVWCSGSVASRVLDIVYIDRGGCVFGESESLHEILDGGVSVNHFGIRVETVVVSCVVVVGGEDLFSKVLGHVVCQEEIENVSPYLCTLIWTDVFVSFPSVFDNGMSKRDTPWNYRDGFLLAFQRFDIVEYFFENSMGLKVVIFGIRSHGVFEKHLTAIARLTKKVAGNELDHIECSLLADIFFNDSLGHVTRAEL